MRQAGREALHLPLCRGAGPLYTSAYPLNKGLCKSSGSARDFLYLQGRVHLQSITSYFQTTARTEETAPLQGALTHI